MQTNFIIKNKNPRIKSLGDNITSHHTMGAFFSSQDNLMLQQEGNDTNCFVSLVVDTRGQYVARVTRKVQTKSEVTIKNLGTSYKFFGEDVKEIANGTKSNTRVVEEEVIEYFDLEVERHEVANPLEYLDTRFEELQKQKDLSLKTNPLNRDNNGTFKDLPGKPFNKTFEEPSFFDTAYESLIPKSKGKDEDTFGWMPDSRKIHKAVVNIVACSFIVNIEKFDLKQWITRHLNKVYKRLFGNYVDIKDSYAFIEWKEFIIQFTLDYYDEDTSLQNIDLDTYVSRIAQAICKELEEFSTNEYIQAYIEELQQYIIE